MLESAYADCEPSDPMENLGSAVVLISAMTKYACPSADPTAVSIYGGRRWGLERGNGKEDAAEEGQRYCPRFYITDIDIDVNEP